MYTIRRAISAAAVVVVTMFSPPAFCADPPAALQQGTPNGSSQSAKVDLARLEAEGRLVRKSELAQYAKKDDVDALITQMQELLAQVRALRAHLEGSEPGALPAPPKDATPATVPGH